MEEEPSDTWTVADLIDFELLVREDEASADDNLETLERRDRAIFLKIEESNCDDSVAKRGLQDNRVLFRKWLQQRRQMKFGRGDSHGDEVHSLLLLFALGLGVVGFLLALGAVEAFSLNSAQGRAGEAAPINVLAFFGVCILWPSIFGFYGVWLTVSHASPVKLPRLPAFLRGLYVRLFAPFLGRTIDSCLLRLPASAKLDGGAIRGDVLAIAKSNKGILSAFFLVCFQALGVGYSVGLPAVLAWKKATVSQDYGWATNADQTLSPERIHSAVSVISVPWSWWKGAEEGYPSLRQVRKTEYDRYSPASNESSEIWSVWATFLLCASITYVTLPRLGLYLFGCFTLKRQLSSEVFGDARFDALRERLLLPKTNWSGKDSGKYQKLEGKGLDQFQLVETESLDEMSCIVAISEDLFSGELAAAVTEHFRMVKQWQVSDSIKLPEDTDGRTEFLSTIPAHLKELEAGRLVLVDDAMMPPARERMDYIKAVRDSVGDKVGIVVALLGPEGEGPLGEKPRDIDFDVWKRKIRKVGDKNLRVVRFL